MSRLGWRLLAAIFAAVAALLATVVALNLRGEGNLSAEIDSASIQVPGPGSDPDALARMR